MNVLEFVTKWRRVELTRTVSCSVVAPGRRESERRGREAKLRDELVSMRPAINMYATDQGKLPRLLDDVVKAGYLREIPADPSTKKPDWKLITGEDPNRQGGIAILDIR